MAGKLFRESGREGCGLHGDQSGRTVVASMEPDSQLPPTTLDQLLTENMLLISAIHECRAAGHDEQGSQYSLRLHKNLMTVSQQVERSKTLSLKKKQQEEAERQAAAK